MTTYLCICAGCDPAGDTPLPFSTPEDREMWRMAHVGAIDLDGTIHVAFTYYDLDVAADHRTPHQQYLDQRAGLSTGKTPGAPR